MAMLNQWYSLHNHRDTSVMLETFEDTKTQILYYGLNSREPISRLLLEIFERKFKMLHNFYNRNAKNS
jgi:hypothetical protein